MTEHLGAGTSLLRAITKGFVDSSLNRVMASAFVPYEEFV